MLAERDECTVTVRDGVKRDREIEADGKEKSG